VGLIGHQLNPDKLAAKVPRNLSGLDMHLVWRAKSASYLLAGTFSHVQCRGQSILETQFQSADPWIFTTTHPSIVDISLYYQLDWGQNIAAGRGIESLIRGWHKGH
jgi:hypothetical protein